MVGFLTEEYCTAVVVQTLGRNTALVSLGVTVLLLLILCVVSLSVAISNQANCPYCPDRQTGTASSTGGLGAQSMTDNSGN